MPHQWYFPRWRYVSMQGIMWLILGGTVGLASLLDGHLSRGVNLADPIVEGPLTFRVPDDWNVVSQTNPGNTRIAYTASKPNDPDAQRNFKIIHEKLSHALFPADVIRGQLGPNGAITRLANKKIDGHAALLVYWSGVQGDDVDADIVQGVACCAIVPSGGAGQSDSVTIVFARVGALEHSDLVLVQQVLEAIKITPQN
jgi:hypothetical protein